MREYRFIDNKFDPRPSNEGLALCLGMFDGLHKGHIKLIKTALKENKNVEVLTFDGNLKQITQKRENGLITTVSDREEILSALGVQSLFVVPFSYDMLNMPPEEFIEKVILPLKPSVVYIGLDFHFGKGAIGNYKTLEKYLKVRLVDFALMESGKKISTGDISTLIRQGEVEKASSYLGRPYALNGKIIHGLGNGKNVLGFPTANLKPDEAYIIPQKGVYATEITMDGIKRLGMTDIGTHPTINELKAISIETFIFGYDGNAYSERAKLEFLKKIRDEKKFSSIEELKSQLKQDYSEVLSLSERKEN